MHPFIEERKTRKRLKKLTGSAGNSMTQEKGSVKRGNAFQVTNTGFRPDVKITARSNWEANFARILEMYGIPWEFEPKVFTFPIKRGTKGYTPDFYLPKTKEWVELKGYLDTRSMTKLKRFKKYYPEEFAKLTMIISKYSRAAKSFCDTIAVPNVIYYEDLGKYYKDIIGDHWQGK